MEFLRQWFDSLHNSIAPSTYDAYRLVVCNQLIPYYEPKKLKVKDLTPVHITDYINYKMQSASANTVRKHIVILSRALESAVKQNIIVFNPTKRIDMPKKVKYMGAKFYNAKQIESLLEGSKGDPLDLVILLTAFYGLRRSECLGLKWDAIDFENKTITIRHTVVVGTRTLYKRDITKNISSHRILPLSSLIADKLKAVKEKRLCNMQQQSKTDINNAYVCVKDDGSLIKPNYVSQHFPLLLKRIGMPVIRFHDLRHSAATYLLSLGFNMKEVSEWLGHGDITTTLNIYAHVDNESKRNMANKLEERYINC